MEPPTPEERHRLYLATYRSKSEDEIREAYRAWAPCYEMHIVDQGWRAPRMCAELLADHVSNRETPVLDVGAGTGLVGVALRDLGFGHLEAADVSTDMLEQARTKDVYDRIHVLNAERMEGIDEDTYGAVICVGALNVGHIPATSLDEFIRVVSPGGFVAFTTREDFYQESSRSVQDELADTNAWELLEERVATGAVADMPHRHWCYRVIRERDR